LADRGVVQCAAIHTHTLIPFSSIPAPVGTEPCEPSVCLFGVCWEHDGNTKCRSVFVPSDKAVAPRGAVAPRDGGDGRRHEVRGMQGALSDYKGASLCCARSLALNLCVQASAVLGAPGCSLDGLPCHMSGLRQQTVQRPTHEARALRIVLRCLASLVVLPRSPFPVLCPS
jgi:hypothetical protein